MKRLSAKPQKSSSSSNSAAGGAEGVGGGVGGSGGAAGGGGGAQHETVHQLDSPVAASSLDQLASNSGRGVSDGHGSVAMPELQTQHSSSFSSTATATAAAAAAAGDAANVASLTSSFKDMMKKVTDRSFVL
jgi:hypothetical protein